MEPGKVLFEHYHKIASDFLDYLSKIPGVFEMEDVHQLRVSIKKLRAIFDFFQEATDGKLMAGPNYSTLKPLFKTAGRIREHQINASLLNEYKASEEIQDAFLRMVDLTDRSDKKQLEEEIRNFDRQAFDAIETDIKKYCENEPGHAIVGHMHQFIQNQFQLVQQIMTGNLNNKLVHKIRIRLKTIKPLLGLAWQLPGSPYTEHDFLKLEETEKFIGSWHDQVLLIEVLDRIMRSPQLSSGPLLETIRDLMLHIEDQSHQLLEQIHTSLAHTASEIENKSIPN